MATRLEHIYAIQNQYHRGSKPDDAKYPSNRLVEHFLNTMRALLVKRKQDKHYTISPMTYQTVCIPLEVSSYEECSCLDEEILPLLEDCTLLKSKCPLPSEITSRWGTSIDVKYLNGNPVPRTSMTSNKYAPYSLAGAGQVEGWFIGDNSYLYVINSSMLQVVLARALWENPADLDGYCDCNEITIGGGSNGSGSTTCHDSLTEEYPIDAELVEPLYSMVMDKLYRSQALPIDNMNDGREVEHLNALDPNERQ